MQISVRRLNRQGVVNESFRSFDFPTRLRTQGRESTLSGKTRTGHFTVLRQTMRQRWQAKLRVLKTELRRRMHTPIPEQGAYLRAVLLGHFRYYSVPMNGPALCSFRKAVGYLWRTTLRRRSQGNHLPWRRMRRYIAKCFRRLMFAILILSCAWAS